MVYTLLLFAVFSVVAVVETCWEDGVWCEGIKIEDEGFRKRDRSRNEKL